MSITTDLTTERLIAELHAIDEKAEIVDGRLERMSPTGLVPGNAGGAIYASLRAFAKRSNISGIALPDNVGFLTDLPHRKSFCPDAAYDTGPRTGMKFASQAPDCAAEVRGEGDYGTHAERAMAAKRSDYFAAGTNVVCDVDLASDETVRVYRAGSSETPTIYRRGQLAEAEPAVPGWTMPVDELFE